MVLVLEVGMIDLQAARGTTSHFNAGDAARRHAVRGDGRQRSWCSWSVSIALTVALFRQRFADRAFGWALRFGLLLSVLGPATGGLMTAPTGAQLEAARTTGHPSVGRHTVGAPDGGAGPAGAPAGAVSTATSACRISSAFTRSRSLPAIVWLDGAAGLDVRRRRTVVVASAAYFSLVRDSAGAGAERAAGVRAGRRRPDRVGGVGPR